MRWCILVLVVACGAPSAPHIGADATPQPPDAAVDGSPDALPDGALDAPPDAGTTFHVSPLDLPVHRSLYDPAKLINVYATNDTTAQLALTVSVAGPFALVNNGCTAADPGVPCVVQLECTAHAFGTYGGTLTLVAGGTTLTVPLQVIDEAFVLATGNVGGSATIDPPDDGCLGCYPPGTVVTMTAIPDAGYHFVGWVDGPEPHVCTTNPCTVTASAASTWNQATFAPDTHSFTLNFIGNGPGTVYVTTSSFPVYCSASCTVQVDTPTFRVGAITAVDFGGFGAPCGTGATCVLPGTTTSLDVDFSIRPGEHDLDVGGGVSVDFDPANELVVGGSAVHVFTATLAPKWTAPFAGAARFAANGDVLVRTSTKLVKLAAADGHVLWQHPTAPFSHFAWGVAHQLAATPSGGAVVNHGDSVEVWAPDGASTFALPLGGTRPSAVATGADGKIYVGVASVEMPFIYSYVEVFSPAGVRQLPDFGSALPEGLNDAQQPSAIGVGTANVVIDEKSEVDDWAGFDQFAADRSYLGVTDYQFAPGSQSLPPQVVATNASDQIAFACHPDTSIQSDSSGLVLIKYDATRHELWRVERYPLGENDYLGGDGFNLADLAMAPDGRTAVVDTRTLVEVFAP